MIKESAVGFFAPMDFLMATGAQAPKIALVIRSAIGKGLHMMHQRCHACSPQPQALLTEWMRLDVSVAVFLPRTSVPLMLIVATGKMLVMPLHQAPMFFAVARPAVGQVWTATVSAGAFWFRWHRVHLDFGHEKTSAGIAPSEVYRHFSMIHDIMSSPVRQKVNEGH